MTKQLIIVEETGTGFSAFPPDLPSCIATGATRAEVEKTMSEAIQSISTAYVKKVSMSPLRTAILRTVKFPPEACDFTTLLATPGAWPAGQIVARTTPSETVLCPKRWKRE